MRTEPGMAVVTGAGSGLGRVISRALLDDGWRVAPAGRREDALVETAAGSSRALVVPTDAAHVGRPGGIAYTATKHARADARGFACRSTRTSRSSP